MIEYLQDPSLKQIKNVQHAFFTRLGGVSSGILASLNCAYRATDKPENVTENRRRAMEQLGTSLESLVSVRNVHGNQAVIVDKPWSWEQQPEADGMVTQLSNVVLATDSADCPIVLFVDELAKVIGIAHAGWRGAKGGILESTVEKMLVLGAKPEQISAAVSPCIAQPSYEVSTDFHQDFLQENAANAPYFIQAPKAGHFLFNLPAYVKGRLLKLNLKSVSTESAVNTYLDERFFSCRRAAHQKEPYFGGQLSCIMMKNIGDC